MKPLLKKPFEDVNQDAIPSIARQKPILFPATAILNSTPKALVAGK
jgi:hypothetical protein